MERKGGKRKKRKQLGVINLSSQHQEKKKARQNLEMECPIWTMRARVVEG
jgi:hypothetical protein